MNIQTVELPKEAIQMLDAEKVLQTAKNRHVEEAAPEAAARQNVRQDAEEGDKDEQPKSKEQVLSEAQDYFRQRGVDLHFRVLEDSGELQVEMTDAGSKRLIRKIPGDEIVKLSDNLKRMAKGIMDKEV